MWYAGLSVFLLLCAATPTFADDARKPASASSAPASAESKLRAPEANSSAPIAAIQGATVAVAASAASSSPLTSPPPQSGNAVDWWARGLGLVSLGAFVFGIFKMKRDRKLSIEDEFWLRKIIIPTAVEPFLKAVVKLLEDLPSDQTSKDQLGIFAFRVTKELQLHGAAIQTLALLDTDLPQMVLERISECEDLLTEHCQKLTNKEISNSAELRDAVWASITNVFIPIREWQHKS